MTQSKTKKNNAVLCPQCGTAYFESQGSCPKCNTIYKKGAVSEYENTFNKVFDDLNDTARDIVTTKKKGRTDSLTTILLLLAFCFCSCGENRRAEIKSTETLQDSVLNEQTVVSKNVDIPRTHLGITLGMSWTEARSLLLSNVCKGLNEDVDNAHKGILAEKSGDWLGNWGTKYSNFYVEVFDGKVYSISVEPQNNPAEVITALKNKYPFDIEENEELRYHNNGLVTKNVKKNYSCSNGKTEIYFDEYSYMIRYRDVNLKIAKSNYWDEVEALAKKAQQEDVNQQLSDY